MNATVCPNCGTTNYLQTGSCWKCGSRLDADLSPPVQTEAEAELAAPEGPSQIEDALPEPGGAEEEEVAPFVLPQARVPPSEEQVTPFVSPEEQVVPDPALDASRKPEPEPLTLEEELAALDDAQPLISTPQPPVHDTRHQALHSCANCGALLHPSALHCWRCGAETAAYTQEVRLHYEWQDRDRQWRERAAVRRTIAEGDQPQLPWSDEIRVQVSGRLVLFLAGALAISVALVLLNLFLGRLLASLPVPFNGADVLLSELSGWGAVAIVPLFLALLAALIARRGANKSDRIDMR